MIGLLKLTKSIYSLFLYYEKHRGAATAAGVETPESVHPPAYAGAVLFFGISNIGTFLCSRSLPDYPDAHLVQEIYW